MQAMNLQNAGDWAVQECVGYGCEEHRLRFWELLMLNPSGVKVKPRPAAPGD
jgi:hypothetical protein